MALYHQETQAVFEGKGMNTAVEIKFRRVEGGREEEQNDPEEYNGGEAPYAIWNHDSSSGD
jgi:hypothetical protein